LIPWVIAGPTASGKSALALALAEHLGGQILCFDSTTVYRGLDIGTGKPTSAERQRCPHYLLDLVEAGQDFSLAHFMQAAEQAVQECSRPILVGGTFLYLRAFLEGYQLPEVGADPDFREWAAGQDPHHLWQELVRLDPSAEGRVERSNPRRVIRALELARAGHGGPPQRSPRFEKVHKVGLSAQSEWLKARIEGRARLMLEQGWREEVQGLCQKGLREWLLSMRFIGYPEVLAALEQSTPDSQLLPEVAQSTWRLAKKQRTWSRSEVGVTWFDAQTPDLLERVLTT
jgi:tRNA dimethylallyltransferase